MDLDRFAALMSHYDSNLSPNQVSVSFEYLSQGTGRVTLAQFHAWGLSLLENAELDECLAGIEELIELATGQDTRIPEIPASQLMQMAGAVLQQATAAQFKAALQSSPVLERKGAAALVGVMKTHERATHGEACQAGSLVERPGTVWLERPCMNRCGQDAQVFFSGLNTAVCRQCAQQLSCFPAIRQSHCAVSTIVPSAQLSGPSAVLATCLHELNTTELRELLHQHASACSALKKAMALLPLPNFIRKPMQLSGELRKLSSKRVWQVRSALLTQTTFSYLEGSRECWRTPLARVRRVRRILLSTEQLEQLDEPMSEFGFGVLVTPVDGPEYEKVFRASGPEELERWVKAIHTNVCLVPTKEKTVPQSVDLDHDLSLNDTVYK